jgi:hypothetical protein
MTETIQYYDHRTKTLLKSQRYKIRKLLEYGCIWKVESTTGKIFKCFPIEGYNKTTYTILIDKLGEVCNCQYFIKNEKTCSHIGAVREFIARNGNDEGIQNTLFT